MLIRHLDGPRGRDLRVAVTDPDATVADLAVGARARPPGGPPLVVGGRTVAACHAARSRRDHPRRHGRPTARRRPAPAHRGPPPAVVVLTVTAGPDAGRSVRLAPGPHPSGGRPIPPSRRGLAGGARHRRAPARPHGLPAPRHDRGVEHRCGPGARPRVHQRHLDRARGRAGPHVAHPARRRGALRRLQLRGGSSATRSGGTDPCRWAPPAPARSTADPAPPPPAPPPPVVVPADPGPPPPVTPVGLVAMLASVATGGAMVVLLGSWSYAAFALLGPVLVLANAIDSRRRRRRHGRRAGRGRARELRALARHLGSGPRAPRSAPHGPTCAGTGRRGAGAHEGAGGCWERRPDHVDARTVCIARGRVGWDPPLAPSGADGSTLAPDVAEVVDAHRWLDDAPVALRLEPGQAVAVVGPRTSPERWCARSWCRRWSPTVRPTCGSGSSPRSGPAGGWDWCAWLPHSSDPAAGSLLAGSEGRGPHRRRRSWRPTPRRRPTRPSPRCTVVVIDDPVRPGRPAERGPDPPAPRGRGRDRHRPDRPGRAPRRRAGVVPVGADRDRGGHGRGSRSGPRAGHRRGGGRGRRPRGRPVPGRPRRPRGRRPGPGPPRHGGPRRPARGRAPHRAGDGGGVARRRRRSAPRAVLGSSAEGPFVVDLVADGPHALVAGTTGAGKSELLRTLVASLAASSSPRHLSFVLIDFKGGSAFDACARLPHVTGVVTDLDDHLAARALRCLDAELRHREERLRAVGRRGPGRPPPARPRRGAPPPPRGRGRRVRHARRRASRVRRLARRGGPARPQPGRAPRAGHPAAVGRGERPDPCQHRAAGGAPRGVGERQHRRDRRTRGGHPPPARTGKGAVPSRTGRARRRAGGALLRSGGPAATRGRATPAGARHRWRCTGSGWRPTTPSPIEPRPGPASPPREAGRTHLDLLVDAAVSAWATSGEPPPRRPWPDPLPRVLPWPLPLGGRPDRRRAGAGVGRPARAPAPRALGLAARRRPPAGGRAPGLGRTTGAPPPRSWRPPRSGIPPDATCT